MDVDPLQELIRIMAIEDDGDDHFVGQSQDLGYRRLYGGQVLGQCLMAAYKTVKGKVAHSLHAYFLRPGSAREPVNYWVERSRDGGTFSARRVVAKQGGKVILTASISFQSPEEGMEHQQTMPPCLGPDELDSEQDRAKALELDEVKRAMVPETLRRRAVSAPAIELRIVEPQDYFEPKKLNPSGQLWMKARGLVGVDLSLQQGLLAYASDFGLLGTCLRPHGQSILDPKLNAASLDHAIWFHRVIKIDEWLLYSLTSPISAHARGFNLGQFYNQSGQLLASTSQEALIRRRQS